MQVLTIIALALVASTSAEKCDKHQEKDKWSRIVNGKEVKPHSIPWQVYILTNLYCGGSIISNQWILTAAHCIFDNPIGQVILGAHNILKKENSQYRANFTEYIIHEDYENFKRNDIALIKLPEPVEFNDYIQPIALNSKADVDGMEVMASGWGQQSNENGSDSEVLRSITVFVEPHSECQSKHSTVQDFHVCTNIDADENGKINSTCFGDSGGPLVGDENTQIGIASFLINKCEGGCSNIFTRVSYYIDWINEKIA